MDTRPSIFAIGALTVRRDGDDAAAFDSIFGKLKPHHEEGQLRGAALVEGHIRGFPLTEATIAELLSGTGVAPAARAALAKTAQNLDWLLSRPV